MKNGKKDCWKRTKPGYRHGSPSGKAGLTCQNPVEPPKGHDSKSSMVAMSCPRCEGFMVTTHSMNSYDATGRCASGWRCVNCGAIIDPVISRNKQRFSPAKTSTRRPRLPR